MSNGGISIAKSTEYAKCQGLNSKKGGIYDGNSTWLLRSAGNYSSEIAYVFQNGEADFTVTTETRLGIRPVCRLSQLKADQSIDIPQIQTFTVTWNVDGEMTSEVYTSGASLVVPSDPDILGKRFLGWSPSPLPDTVTDNLVFTALFEDVEFTAGNWEQYSVGDQIQFGNYPQSRVDDADLVSALEAESSPWVSYGYYSGTDNSTNGQMTPGDYMKYRDVLYGGNKYRCVCFTAYRPFFTGVAADDTGTSYAYQVTNGYYVNEHYWFEFEPLVWRVLDPRAGFIMSEKVIDAQPYSNYILTYNSLTYGDSDMLHYANSYYYSSVREWLNSDFYNTAFTSDQQQNIEVTRIKNNCFAPAYSELDSPASNDKVYLLSYWDIMETAYGFDASTGNWDTARRGQSTDYEKCMGNPESDLSMLQGNCLWWLRSPSNLTDCSCHINCDGSFGGYSFPGSIGGIRPACRLTSLTPDTDITSSTLSGKCGDDLSWTLNTKTGVLQISGSGDMYDYDSNLHGDPTYAPWFEHCMDIRTVVIDDGVTSIGDGAFLACSGLTDVRIPEGVLSIGEEAFLGCSSLERVTLPDSLAGIGNIAFRDCTALESLTVPENVTYIGQYAFALCTGLTDVTFIDGTYPVFFERSLFAGCESLETVDLPDKLIGIPEEMFLLCAIQSITIPEGVSFIGSSAFLDCAELETIDLPKSLNAVHPCAFSGCPALETVDFGGSSSDWDTLVQNVSVGNDPLLNANIRFSCFTVTWKAGDDETVDEYASGDAFVKAADPVIEGKLFTGWSPDEYPETVTEDLVFTANFKEMKSDASTGVSVIFDAAVFDEDEAELELFVDPIDKDEERFAGFKTYTGGDDVYGLYEVCLRKDGVKVQPNGGKVTVRIPVPAELDLGSSFYIYHLKDDGTDEIISLKKGNLRVSEDGAYFECDITSFSEFAVCVHIEKITFPVTFVRGSGETVTTTITLPLSRCNVSQHGGEEVAIANIKANDALITAALSEAGLEDFEAVSDDGRIYFIARGADGEWTPDETEIDISLNESGRQSFWEGFIENFKALLLLLFRLIIGV